jgi:hypothetical protein
MSTGIMETVAQGVTLVRIWTTSSAVRILRMYEVSYAMRATVSRWLALVSSCEASRSVSVCVRLNRADWK